MLFWGPAVGCDAGRVTKLMNQIYTVEAAAMALDGAGTAIVGAVGGGVGMGVRGGRRGGSGALLLHLSLAASAAAAKDKRPP